MKLRFKCGYDLETEYVVEGGAYDGMPILVRVGMHEQNTRGDYQPTIRKLIGTVRRGYWFGQEEDEKGYHEYPPAEVIALVASEWSIPLVPARWTDEWEVEYMGKAPSAPIPVWGGTTWMCPEWEEHCKRLAV